MYRYLLNYYMLYYYLDAQKAGQMYRFFPDNN